MDLSCCCIERCPWITNNDYNTNEIFSSNKYFIKQIARVKEFLKHEVL